MAGETNFVVAHFTGKVTYDVRAMSAKNRDFLPPEMIETLRLSNDRNVKHMFTAQLSKSGNVTAPSPPGGVSRPTKEGPKKTRWGAALIAETGKCRVSPRSRSVPQAAACFESPARAAAWRYPSQTETPSAAGIPRGKCPWAWGMPAAQMAPLYRDGTPEKIDIPLPKNRELEEVKKYGCQRIFYLRLVGGAKSSIGCVRILKSAFFVHSEKSSPKI